MAQNGTKIVLVFVFLLAGLLVAAQVQAAETTASTAPASVQASPDLIDWFHNPEPWLEQGADFRFREHDGYDWTKLNNDLKYKGDFDNSRFILKDTVPAVWTNSNWMKTPLLIQGSPGNFEHGTNR